MSCIQLGGRSHISWTAQTYIYAREWCNKPEGPQCALAAVHHYSKPKYIHWLLFKLFFFKYERTTLNFSILNPLYHRGIICEIRENTSRSCWEDHQFVHNTEIQHNFIYCHDKSSTRAIKFTQTFLVPYFKHLKQLQFLTKPLKCHQEDWFSARLDNPVPHKSEEGT